MEKGKHKELILNLKRDRLRWEWSYQYICDRLEEIKLPISMSSIRRVFAEGSENEAFNYNNTLRPLAILFYETNKPTPPRIPGDEEQAEELWEQVEGLKATIASKNEVIQIITAQKEEFKEAVNKRDRTIVFSRRVLSALLAISIVLLVTNIITMGLLIKILL